MVRPLFSLLLAPALVVVSALPLPPVQAQMPAPRAAAQPDELQQAIAKSNAYVQLLNRTLRGKESWNRYTSWVNVKTGPTGKERIIYGLYSLYDVKGEVEKARAAIKQPPAMPALDVAMDKYIVDYEAYAAVIGPMEKYYERKDYMADKMAEGKTFHAKVTPLAQAFLASRDAADKAMAVIKADLDQRELADIEKREGKAARWHMRNVMIETRRMVDLLPSGENPVVNLAAFDAALERYSAAVKEFDAYGGANPGAFSTMDSRPGNYLGKLREFRNKIGRTKGDARRANAGMELTWLINDYNMMVSMADMAARMRR
ncbi:MAG: YiiG family protein [Beijerinckiaceae bacterium]